MFFFMVDKSTYVMTNASEETIKEFWNRYCTYRYDKDFSFPRFLEENDLDVKVVAPSLTFFGYNLDEVEVFLN